MDSLELINLIFIVFVILFGGLIGLRRLKQGNVSFVFYALYCVFLGVFQLFAYFITSNPMIDFDIGVRLKANILNVGVLFFLFLGETLILQKTKINKNLPSKRIGKRRIKFYLSVVMWSAFILSVFGFLFMIWSKGIPLDLLLEREARLKYRFGQRGSLTLASWLFSLVLISGYISLIKKRWTIFGIGTLLTITAISITGTRAYLFYIIGPYLYYYITTRKMRLKNIVSLGLVLGLSILVFMNIQLWRWQPERTPQAFLKQFFSKESCTFLFSYYSSEFNRSISNFQAIKAFPEQHDWLYGNTYKTVFLFWLPSGMSQRIKVDTMYKFSDIVRGTTTSYEERASYHPTFTGDSYINFGYLFWLPALILGAGLAIMYIKARKNIFWNLLAGSSLVYFLALVFRGSIYNAFFQLIISAALLLFAIFILNIPNKFSKKINEGW